MDYNNAQLFPPLGVHNLCTVCLQRFPMKDGTHFSSPWVWAGLQTIFGQQKGVEVMPSQFWALRPRVLLFFCWDAHLPGESKCTPASCRVRPCQRTSLCQHPTRRDHDRASLRQPPAEWDHMKDTKSSTPVRYSIEFALLWWIHSNTLRECLKPQTGSNPT